MKIHSKYNFGQFRKIHEQDADFNKPTYPYPKTISLALLLEHIKYILFNEKQFDPNNSDMLIFSQELKQIIGVDALHISSLRTKVKSHLQLSRILKNSKSVTKLYPPARKTSTSMVWQNDFFDNKNNLYTINEPLRECFSHLNSFDKNKRHFSMKEVGSFFGQYISENKELFFRNNNFSVCIVEGTLLGRALGVKAFHNVQRKAIVCRQLKLVKPNKISLEKKLEQIVVAL